MFPWAGTHKGLAHPLRPALTLCCTQMAPKTRKTGGFVPCSECCRGSREFGPPRSAPPKSWQFFSSSSLTPLLSLVGLPAFLNPLSLRSQGSSPQLAEHNSGVMERLQCSSSCAGFAALSPPVCGCPPHAATVTAAVPPLPPHSHSAGFPPKGYLQFVKDLVLSTEFYYADFLKNSPLFFFLFFNRSI